MVSELNLKPTRPNPLIKSPNWSHPSRTLKSKIQRQPISFPINPRGTSVHEFIVDFCLNTPFFIVLSQKQNKFYTKLQKTKNLTHAHRFHKHHHAHHTINPKKKETEERDWRGARIFYAWLVSVKVRMRSFSRLLHGILFFCGSAYWANTVSGAYGFVVLDRLAFQLWCICLLSSFVAGLEVW